MSCNKRKVLVLICLLIVIVLVLFFCCFLEAISQNREVIVNKTTNLMNSDTISMMYETWYQSGEYETTSDVSWPGEGYVFNETLSKCENGGTLSWDEASKKVLMASNRSDKCYIYFDREPEKLANYIKEYIYTTDGENGLYYHDGTGTYGTLEAGDNSYRYAGASPNNYVCFGTNDEICSEDNLYRIIGVFDGQIKLIKSDYATKNMLGTDGGYADAKYTDAWDIDTYKGSQSELIPIYRWNFDSDNTWGNAQLNTINLNQNYLNTLGSEWQEKIVTTNWIVGGNTGENIAYQNAPTVYQNEIVNPAETTVYSAKIGLMYVSDYMYGASPTYWTYVGNGDSSSTDYRKAINENWMYMGLIEWTISRCSDRYYRAFCLSNDGGVIDNGSVQNIVAVRPSFYLESSVEFSSGNGTIDSPYRIQA